MKYVEYSGEVHTTAFWFLDLLVKIGVIRELAHEIFMEPRDVIGVYIIMEKKGA